MKLQTIRKSKLMTQKELAALSGVPLRTVQQYETGARNINGASLTTLCNMALVLDVKFYDLLEDESLIVKIKATL
jgi:transcriptional regulator with XRE-family HTH domain